MTGRWLWERGPVPTDVPSSGEAPLAPPWEEWYLDVELLLYRYGFRPMLYIYTRRQWHLAVVRARWRTPEFIAYRCDMQFCQAARLYDVSLTYLWGTDAVRVAVPPGRYLGLRIPPRGPAGGRLHGHERRRARSRTGFRPEAEQDAGRAV